MPNSRNFDHLYSGKFKIEIEGVTVGAFIACDGIESTTDVVTYVNGDDGSDNVPQVRKRPGHTRYANIVLRRGMLVNTELWDWYQAVVDGEVQRKAGSIIICGDDGKEKFRYNFFEGWPCRWKSLVLDAGDAGSLVEEIEIAVEKVERG